MNDEFKETEKEIKRLKDKKKLNDKKEELSKLKNKLEPTLISKIMKFINNLQ